MVAFHSGAILFLLLRFQHSWLDNLPVAASDQIFCDRVSGSVSIPEILIIICWYQKAIEYMETAVSHITAAFVSTNSICQGESGPAFWKQLVVDHKAEIQFAYSTFIWDSEASSKAHVHCVIVGFTYGSVRKPKKLLMVRM